jgi:hypothetical protein
VRSDFTLARANDEQEGELYRYVRCHLGASDVVNTEISTESEAGV